MPKESPIQRQILDWIRLQGQLAVRVNSGAIVAEYKGKKRFIKMNDTPGCADILCCWHGTFIAIEVKAPGARTDRKRAIKQLAFAQRVSDAGGVALTVCSLAELEADLREIA